MTALARFPASELPGVVLRYDEVSVDVHVEAPGGSIEVLLPRVLFGQNCWVGMPFYFGFIETNGRNVMSVWPRPVAPLDVDV